MGKLVNQLTWSVSRHQLFRTCERAYFYQYYGSWGGWEDHAPQRTRQLYVLKNIRSLPMWGGSIVHEVIAEALTRFARTGATIKTGELQARGRQKLRSGWIEAVRGEWRRRPKKTNLLELYYGNGKNLPAEDTERIKERVYSCLQAFAESAVLREIQTVPYVNWKPVDALDSFSLDGLKVWCAIDFACIGPDGNLRIVDWKTGREDPSSLETQLACYALFAQQAWYAPLDGMRLEGVFLGDAARVSEYPIRPELLVATKDLIVSSAADMRAKLTNVRNNEAREADFPCCESPAVCRRCNYREVCPFARDGLPEASRPEVVRKGSGTTDERG